MDHLELLKGNISLSRQLRDQLEADPINFLDVKAKELWAESIEIFSEFLMPIKMD